MTSFTLSEIAELCGAQLTGDGSLEITGPAPLADAGPSEVSFLGDYRYAKHLATTRAGAVLLAEGVETPRDDLAILRCENPSRAFNEVIVAFAPPRSVPEPGIHPTAFVDPTAEIASDASIGALCVIGAQVKIAAGVAVHSGAQIAEHVELGRDSIVYSNAVLYPYVRMGERCIIHGGAVLGADGFGYEPTPQGWVKKPQEGIVVLEDDVEIGANTTIDRARFGATLVRRNAKIDNLVQLGHNVQVGESAMLFGQVGIGGSTHIGKGAILAGQVGVIDHLRIGDGARLGAGTGVLRSIPAGQECLGYPAEQKRDAIRAHRELMRLRDLRKQVERMEARLAELEERE